MKFTVDIVSDDSQQFNISYNAVEIHAKKKREKKLTIKRKIPAVRAESVESEHSFHCEKVNSKQNKQLQSITDLSRSRSTPARPKSLKHADAKSRRNSSLTSMNTKSRSSKIERSKPNTRPSRSKIGTIKKKT